MLREQPVEGFLQTRSLPWLPVNANRSEDDIIFDDDGDEESAGDLGQINWRQSASDFDMRFRSFDKQFHRCYKRATFFGENFIVAGVEDNSSIVIWDKTTGETVHLLPAYCNSFSWDLKVHQNACMLAEMTDVVRIWSPMGAEVRQMSSPEGE
ncbi:unnamed protein product [Cyprideis torosa]|uniref:Uncharacterized protein n=1 Tax=Cyprideis torosa TaxID=163714 RepID=A0A7R8WRP4_9CRUS|nr:unnamed protein product [Cyprideis torosa]CAG0908896.1 unnamed protein product [Cyprideis torosa]